MTEQQRLDELSEADRQAIVKLDQMANVRWLIELVRELADTRAALQTATDEIAALKAQWNAESLDAEQERAVLSAALQRVREVIDERAHTTWSGVRWAAVDADGLKADVRAALVGAPTEKPESA